MIREEEVFCMGRLGKPHGVKGELTLRFTSDAFAEADADYLVVRVEGILVPFFMDDWRITSDSVALVKFCGVDDKRRAAELTGCDVFFPLSLAPLGDGELPLAGVVGFALVDASSGKTVGEIASVDDATANTLFRLADGRLVPASPELIEGVDAARREVSVRIAEGLLDL